MSSEVGPVVQEMYSEACGWRRFRVRAAEVYGTGNLACAESVNHWLDAHADAVVVSIQFVSYPATGAMILYREELTRGGAE